MAEYLNWTLASIFAVLLLVIGLSVGTSNEAAKVVKASEILTKIEKDEPIEYDHITISGDLSPGQSNRPDNRTLITSLIRINESIIDGNVNFDNMIFLKPVNFRKTIFLGEANFLASKFNESADFSRAKLREDADFTASKFNDEANFEKIEFDGDAEFSGSVYNKTAQFSGAKFKGSADFQDAKINGSAYFDGCHFTDAFFESTTFNNTLYLNRTKYDRFYINFKNIKKNLAYDQFAYRLLIDNFKKLGSPEDANNCYFQYRELRLQRAFQRFWNISSKFDNVLVNESLQSDFFILESEAITQYIGGYSVKPYPIIWSIIFIWLFGYYWGTTLRKSKQAYFIDEYSYQEEWDSKEHRDASFGRAFIGSFHMIKEGMIFSFYLFFSGSTLSIIKPPPPPKLPIGSDKWAGRLYTLERVWGTLLTFYISLYLSKAIYGI